uniref:Uncharacterized protein n=1 Tax=Roseihalotalea indica TaxID=2867963 RepID=A0AA49GRU3_9BACT|nr:hypothetical protein K4G66_08855 [Tunicatimonas sp. TK19036]
MKKIIMSVALLALLAFTTAPVEPLVSEKSLQKAGYGEKKMKKAPKKVFINSFFVNYQLVAGARASSATGVSKTGMTVALDGVDSDQLQEVTNKAYNRFVNKLKENGYQIVSADDAAGIEAYNDWERLSGGTPNKAQLTGYLSTAPANYDFFVRRVTNKGKNKRNFFDIAPKLSKQLDDAVVFEGAFNFQYVELDASSNYLVESSKVKAKVNFKLPSSAIAQSEKGLLGQGSATSSPTLARFVYKGKAAGAGAESIIAYSPKKDIEIPGVIEKKKFKEYTANPNHPYSTPAYYGIMMEKDVKVSHRVQADTDAYLASAEESLNSYLDFMVDRLLESAGN